MLAALLPPFTDVVGPPQDASRGGKRVLVGGRSTRSRSNGGATERSRCWIRTATRSGSTRTSLNPHRRKVRSSSEPERSGVRRIAKNAAEHGVEHRVVFGFSYQSAGQLVEFLKTHRHDLRQVTGVRYSGELGHPFHVDIGLRVAADAETGVVDWSLVFPDGAVGLAQSRVTETTRGTSIYSFVLHALPWRSKRLRAHSRLSVPFCGRSWQR